MNSNQDFMDFYRSQFNMNKQMINRKMSRFFKINRFSQMNNWIIKGVIKYWKNKMKIKICRQKKQIPKNNKLKMMKK